MKSLIKYSLLGLMLLLSQTAVWAQAPKYVEDLNGLPIKMRQYENIKGSPYLHEDWKEGRVVLGNGSFYENVPLRYDLVEDLLLFRTREGRELEFEQLVQEFEFNGAPHVYRSGFAPVDHHTAATFYQVLEDGEAKLLRKSHKVVREEITYGTATIQKNILEYTNYYLARGGQLVKIRSGKELLQALPGHAAALVEYVRKYKLKLKSEAEMAQLVAYYNTL